MSVGSFFSQALSTGTVFIEFCNTERLISSRLCNGERSITIPLAAAHVVSANTVQAVPATSFTQHFSSCGAPEKEKLLLPFLSFYQQHGWLKETKQTKLIVGHAKAAMAAHRCLSSAILATQSWPGGCSWSEMVVATASPGHSWLQGCPQHQPWATPSAGLNLMAAPSADTAPSRHGLAAPPEKKLEGNSARKGPQPPCQYGAQGALQEEASTAAEPGVVWPSCGNHVGPAQPGQLPDQKPEAKRAFPPLVHFRMCFHRSVFNSFNWFTECQSSNLAS